MKSYLQHLNAFRERRKIEPLSTSEIALYYILMEYNNELGWPELFTIANGVAEGLAGLTTPTFKRARAGLVNKGYIEYKNGRGSQCGQYLIVELCTANEPQSVPQMTPLTRPKTKTKEKDILKDIPKEKDSVPFAEIQNMFNTLCPSLSKIVSIEGKRRDAVRARFNTYGLDAFRQVFAACESSAFLKGNNNRGWKANFDWLMCPTNFPKVLEGTYANPAPPPSAPKEDFSNAKWEEWDKP